MTPPRWTEQMEEQLIGIKNAALSLILEANSHKELEEIKLQFLGRNGTFSLALKDLPKIPKEKRPSVGRLANTVKITIEDAIIQASAKIKAQNVKHQKDTIDKTAPGIQPQIGHLHPMTTTILEVVDIFKQIGFQIADGPEIETDYYNFETLNIPKSHPSRDTQATLFLDARNTTITPGDLLLRTQTSNMQVRIMEKAKPPFRVIVPGKVYRYEQVDASHGFEFWQFEGFMVDKHVSLNNLFGVLSYFVKQFYGQQTKIKFVCHNFPFVEPGVEAYISCSVCKGKGCSFCKKSGWVELLGAGMIHPNVLKAAGIDPKQYQGFAFGTGMSRLVTLKYQMDDLRLLTNPDLRILEQF